jgi:hypothetical protein
MACAVWYRQPDVTKVDRRNIPMSTSEPSCLTESEDRDRKTYKSPVLKEFGKISDITKAALEDPTDGGEPVGSASV